jgi:hypothetical protein
MKPFSIVIQLNVVKIATADGYIAAIAVAHGFAIQRKRPLNDVIEFRHKSLRV